MSLPELPQDKANHCIYGAIIFEVAFSIGAPLIIALLITLIIACLKEFSDYVIDTRNMKAGAPPSHDVDVWDVVATVSGGLAIYTVNLIALMKP